MTTLEARASKIAQRLHHDDRDREMIAAALVAFAREYGEQVLRQYDSLAIISRGMTPQQRRDAALAAAEENDK